MIAECGLAYSCLFYSFISGHQKSRLAVPRDNQSHPVSKLFKKALREDFESCFDSSRTDIKIFLNPSYSSQLIMLGRTEFNLHQTSAFPRLALGRRSCAFSNQQGD